MSLTETSLRSALSSVGFEVAPDVPAALCGAMAAAGFIAVTELDHDSQQDQWAAHHDFARGLSDLLQQYFDEPSVAWSVLLNQIGFAMPEVAVAEPLQTAATPCLAVRLAAACCTLISIGPDPAEGAEQAVHAQAMSIVTDVAARLGALADPDHVAATLS